MRYRIAAALLLCAAAAPRHAHAQAPTAADSAAIRQVVLDYAQAWYAGDAARMERAVHPALAKRMVEPDAQGRSTLDQMTAAELVELTRGGGGSRTPAAERQADVRILDIFGNAASVRATMSGWVDYLHLARWNGSWVIVNALWELKP
ncbi:MAG TPA: nuclear transport factor 2 family protein [Longimicrobium sp.]|nr:nuclear transport factor 2 family protein [Longimicrobium sp.]